MGCPIKKIMVTGSSGFVGGRFVSDFSDKYELQTPNLRLTPVTHLDFSQVDAVVHCAALVHQMQGAPEDKYFKINHDLTLDLAKAAKTNGVRHFIFISTAHVFGDSGSLDHSKVLSPSSPCNPTDGYGRSKLAAEKSLQEIESEDFKVSIIRPPMVYGEGAKGNLVKLAKLIRRIPILPFGYTKNRRSLVYVGNLTQFIDLVLQTEATGVLLPQDERSLSIKEIAQLIAKALSKKTVFVPIPHVFVKVLAFALPKTIHRLYGTLALDPNRSGPMKTYVPQHSTADAFERMLQQIRPVGGRSEI